MDARPTEARAAQGPPGAAPTRRDWTRARRFLLVAAAAGLADILVGLLAPPGRPALVLHDGLQLAAAVTAAFACFACGQGHPGRARAGWRLVGAGAAAWALGQVAWTWHEVVLQVPPPVAGPSDAAYLAMYPLVVAGLLVLSPVADLRGLGRAALVLDGVLSSMTVAVLAWPLVLDPALHDAGHAVDGYVTVAYPLSDIVVLGLAGGALLRGKASWRSGYGLVYLAFLLILAADLGYAAGVLGAGYATGAVLDAGWIVGFLVLAAAASAPTAAAARSGETYAQVIGHLLPLVAVVGSIFAVFASLLREGTVDFGLGLAISVTVLLAAARQGIAGWEFRVAARQREAAQADYRALFANMTEGVAHCRMLHEDGRPDFVYLRVNQHFDSLTGMKDVVGKRVSQLVPGIQGMNPEVWAAYARVAHGGRPERLEVEVKGLGRWFSIGTYAAGPGEFVAVFANITERKQAEERLRFQARLLDSVGQAVMATDASGRITYWGPGAVALYGWNAGEVLGRSVVEVTPSEASQAQAEQIMTSLGAGKPWSGEFVVRRKDGSSFHALVRDDPILDDDGRLVGIIGVSQDISGTKQLELDLRERMKELTALSAVATAGAKADDLQALLDHAVHSLEKAFLHDDAWVLARAGGLQATSEGVQPDGAELRSVRALDGEGAISVRYRRRHEAKDDGPFLKEERALVDAVADLLTTVMGRKVEAERVRFQAHLLESVSQAVTATDLEGRVTYWNPAAERLFGWPRAEAIGRPIVDLWGDVLVLSPQAGPEEPAAAGDYPMRRKDGSPILVNLATSPLLGPGGALDGFIAIAQDATEARAQALALRRRERALTLISAMNETLIHAESEPQLLQDICDLAVQTGGYRLAWVGLARDTPGHPVEPVAWAGKGSDYLRTLGVTWDNAPRGQVTGKCIREGRTVTMRDIARDPTYGPWREQALAQGYAASISLFLPLGEARGALMMYSEQPEAFEADEVSLLEQMAADLAFGVRTLRLRAKEAALAAMLDDAQALSRIGAWEYDPAARKVTWTREVYRIHEVPESFDPGDPSRDMRFYAEADQRRLDAAFRAAVEQGRPYDLELRLTTARGRQRDVRTVGIPEMRDGKVVRVRGNLMDITEQKAAHEALRRSEERLREAQATAHLGAWELDVPSGRLTWSDEIFRLFEVDQARFGATYEAFLAAIHPEDRKLVDEAFRASLEERKPYAIAHRLLMPDGRVKHVLERGRSEYGPDGKPVRSVGTVLDVTEQHAAEEARRELERKDREVKRLQDLNKMRMEFLNTAAHDLKTPLTPLKLQMATLRLKGSLDPSQRESLDLMDRNLNRFQVLIDDMLDAARLQSGRIKLRREAVELAPLVKEAIASFRESAEQAKVELTLGTLPSVRIDADPTKCMQVLMNLVSNAVKFTPPGGRVDVSIEATASQAVVQLRDTGLGMSAEQLGRLFQPFVRLHEEVKGVAKGTGLGLYISKGIVEEHGGRLWAESEGSGKGSTFRVAWPLAGVARSDQAGGDGKPGNGKLMPAPAAA